MPRLECVIILKSQIKDFICLDRFLKWQIQGRKKDRSHGFKAVKIPPNSLWFRTQAHTQVHLIFLVTMLTQNFVGNVRNTLRFFNLYEEPSMKRLKNLDVNFLYF